MNAAATLHRLTDAPSTIAAPPGPMVLLDGQLRTDLAVSSLSIDGPLDTRSAVIELRRDTASHQAGERARLADDDAAQVTIALPVALAGGEDRLMPLLCGRMSQADQWLDARRDRLSMTVDCHWSRLLDQPWDLDSRIDARLERQLTVARAIEHFNEATGLGLAIDGALVETPVRPVTRAMLRARTVGAALERLLNEYGLYVQRKMRWDGFRITERRFVRSASHGRPIRLALTQLANPAGAVQALRGAVRRDTPVKLTALAEGQIVESTFTLVPGWDDMGEGLDDGQYARSTSSHFDAVANIYRLWVLNEDGAYSGEPFNRGPAFDLTGLFDEGRPVEPRPLRFGPSLSRDAGGRSMGIVIDVSTDAGASWSRYSGRAIVLADRAGVYLDDDTLPAAYFAAAKAHEAIVRVTATLRSPLPLQAVRWRGNPFAGPFEERRFELGGRFARRRVALASKYHAEIVADIRQADQIDDRAALAAWLAEQGRVTEPRGAEVEIETAGVTAALRLGDRLTAMTGRRIGATFDDPAAIDPPATLTAIRHDFFRHRSTLRWRIAQ